MPLIKGTILHDSFETALSTADFSTEALTKTIQQKIAASLADIYAVSETEASARSKLEVLTCSTIIMLACANHFCSVCHSKYAKVG